MADEVEDVQAALQTAESASWYRLSMDAQVALNNAASDCAHASNTEMLDMFSKSKTISMMSTFDTSHAAASVRRANSAAQTLASALPKRASRSDIQAPNDQLDLIVDLSDMLSFDLLSFMNIARPDSVARECRKVAANLGPTHEKLHTPSLEAEARHSEALSELRAIEAPYLAAATAQVPSAIRCAVPAGFGAIALETQSRKSA